MQARLASIAFNHFHCPSVRLPTARRNCRITLFSKFIHLFATCTVITDPLYIFILYGEKHARLHPKTQYMPKIITHTHTHRPPYTVNLNNINCRCELCVCCSRGRKCPFLNLTREHTIAAVS